MKASRSSWISRTGRVPAAALFGLLTFLSASGCGAPPEPTPSRSPAPSVYDLPPERFIYAGMEARLLKRLVGEPQEVWESPKGEIWYYDFGAVIVEGRRVVYAYPTPEASLAERPAYVAPEGRSGGGTLDFE